MPKTIQVIRIEDPSIVIRDGVAIWQGEPVDIILGDVIELTEERRPRDDREFETVADWLASLGEPDQECRRLVQEWEPVEERDPNVRGEL